jgi:hypothetical protein
MENLEVQGESIPKTAKPAAGGGTEAMKGERLPGLLAWVFVALASVAIGLFARLDMGRLPDREWFARGYLGAFVLFTLGAIWCIHLWSMARFSELSMEYAAEYAKEKKTGSTETERKCDYCPEANRLIVCSKCGVIQWATLRRWKKGAIAVFVAHHRWALLTPALSVGIVGALAFAGQLEARLWQQRADAQSGHDAQARAVIDATTGVRSALVQLAAFCRTGEIADSKCRDEFKTVLDQYPRLSWHAPPLLAYLMKARCSEGSSNKACPLLREQEKLGKDLVGCMDTAYRDVMAAFTGDDPAQRCKSAKALYYHGRRLSCAINWLSFGPEPDDPGYTMFTGCTDVLSKTACDDPGEPSDNSRRLWQTWGCDGPSQTATLPGNMTTGRETLD